MADGNGTRDLDLVIYGATGFTGRQSARYLAAHAPETLRWALAGRDRKKLEGVQRELEGAGPRRPVELLRADATDRPSIDAMARRARVIASTAGPFAQYSDAVVAACVAAKTDYADITGETPWVRRLIDRDHARAAEDGTRIVPCCGFDSIPSDLGTFLVVEFIRETFKQATRRVSSAFQLGGGGLNGGTAASALLMAETGDARALANPLLLVPKDKRDLVTGDRPRRNAGHDADHDAWLAPFVMSQVNSQNVLRSAALWAERGAPYGPRFAYDESLKVKRRLTATAFAVGSRLGEGLLASKLGRGLLRRFVPNPGQGPSEEAMAKGWFKTRLVGEAVDGRKARGEVSCQGDAGNRATVLMLCESAMALAVDRERLPHGGGLLTPSTAMGHVLAERLRRAGMTLTVAAM